MKDADANRIIKEATLFAKEALDIFNNNDTKTDLIEDISDLECSHLTQLYLVFNLGLKSGKEEMMYKFMGGSKD